MSIGQKTILFIISFWIINCHAQNIVISRQVIGSYGSSHNLSNMVIMDNVGEVAVKTDSSASIILSQGFEQSNYSISPVTIELTPANAFSPDGDGTNDTFDVFPLDNSEWIDTDNDGIGNNMDDDDDGDQVLDVEDWFPLDGTESSDMDGDGIGDNSRELTRI